MPPLVQKNIPPGIGGPPTGPAGGDLAGLYPTPTVASVGGVPAARLAAGLTVVRMPLALVTKISSLTIPNGAIVSWAVLVVTTPYSVGTTWAVTRTGDGTKILMAAADSDPEVADAYQVPQALDWGAVGAGTVTATVAGAPAAGAAILYIAYSLTLDIS